MTVKDLIEVLQQCPEPECESKIRIVTRAADGLDWRDVNIADIHEDHGIVILETES